MISPPEREGRAARLFGWWNARLPTAGHLALAALAVGVATGVALSAAYDVASPGRALALVQLTSRAGRILRAVHAWSGDLLLVLGVLHAVEHLATRSDVRLRTGPWLRIVASAPLGLALLLSGFVLKGDAAGELARSVVRGLLELVPGGAAAATALLGAGPDLQLVYLHHAATLTLAVAAIAVEHGRRLWPSAGAFVGLLAAAAAAGVLVPPALHDGVDPWVKGPWYFAAVQEVLRLLPEPGWIWAAFAAPLGALAVLPRLRPRQRRAVLASLAAALVAYAVVGACSHLLRGPPPVGASVAGGPPSRRPVPALRPMPLGRLDPARLRLVRGQVEGCLGCHDQVAGIEPAHAPEALGCASCHLGDPFAPDAGAAHAGMVSVPGNLDSAPLTCGRAGCHGGIVARVGGSLMATVRGMIAVDRWAFGEQPTPDGTATAAQLGSSPADTHLRQLCVSCHLARVKERPGPATELSRGGGCVACHLHEPDRRDYAPSSARRFAHPRLSIAVKDESCSGCHARSARISLSYAGWAEAGEADAAGGAPAELRRLQDGRTLIRQGADVHHEKGMACVDCHTARETMGDGEVHLHEEQATRVRCTTCHRTGPGRSAAPERLDAEAQAVLRARFGDAPPPRLLLEDRTGEVLTNAWELPDGSVELRGKLSGKRHVATPPARACRAIAGHERLSCQACHSPWATSCITCHTQWDPRAVRAPPGGPREPGAWIEYEGTPRVDAPALGVLTRDGRAEIEPAVPGMIQTLNGPDVPPPPELPDRSGPLVGERTRFLRAWSFAVPHTTTRAGRSCASCHLDPFALGYGRGELSLERDGGAWRWRFEPALARSERDGLPEDAWIPFLSGGGGVATRAALAPLDRDAQLRTLAVGACLACHDPGRGGRGIYLRFRESLARATPRCRVPASP